MKNILLLTLILSCSAQKTQQSDDLEAHDQKILDALHEEPMKMGTKKVLKEGIMTTEIWTYSDEHGPQNNIVETLLYKNGKLISHTISDSAAGHTFSRQFKDNKVIEASEVKRGKTSTLFFDENEKILGRINTDGKTSECYLYTHGENPRQEKIEVCERRFNSAP